MKKWIVSMVTLTSVTVLANTLYVDLNSTNPTPPFSSWETAATNIQHACDYGGAEDLILVADGHYYISEPIEPQSGQMLQSVNGAEFTTIDAVWYARAVTLSGASVLDGFSIINGYSTGIGGGVFCSSDSLVKNCVISDCAAEGNGGAIYRGVVTNCIVEWNWAYDYGGGLYDTTAIDCIIRNNDARLYGGGTYNSDVLTCCVYSNYSGSFGGGIYGGTVNNSLVYGNYAGSDGGGISQSRVENSTICDNYSNGNGGGAHSCYIYNSIVYFNDSRYSTRNLYYSDEAVFNCAPDISHGLYGNITNAPSFVNRTNENYRLQESSLCINAGVNAHAAIAFDLDGNPRITYVSVDMGAYEFQSADSNADPDGDGLTNAEEARYGTNPNVVDSDGDGFDDLTEVINGMNPTLADNWIAAYVANNADVFGFSASGVVDVAVGQMLVGVSNGYANLTLQLQKSADLVAWTNAGDSVEWTMPVEASNQFFRVSAEP
jgi:hypothetical protein